MNIRILNILLFVIIPFLVFSQVHMDIIAAETVFSGFKNSKKIGQSGDDILVDHFSEKDSLSFYKKYISSQDQQVCTFYPSCSEYSTLAFSNFNFILACLITCDRIHRCHHLSPEKYPIHIASGLQHDPIPISESKDD